MEALKERFFIGRFAKTHCIIVWIYDDTGFTIEAIDNKQISEYWWALDNVSFTKTLADSTFHHAFRDTGWQHLWLKVKDDEDNWSTVLKDSVLVKAGYPTVAIDSLDTMVSRVFVNDARQYYFHSFDPNGRVRKICINWNGGTTANDSLIVNAQSVNNYFTHKYPITQAGPKQVKIWAVDEDTIRSGVITFAVTVRLGAPVIDSIAPDTVWVRDVNTFTASSHDTNGLADSFEIDWNNDGIFDDRNGSGTFAHAFDTSTTGMRPVVVHVMDNDSVWSIRALSVLVRLGRPIVKEGVSSDTIQWVRGAVYDTMFYVYKGSGNTWVTIDASDTNGFMQRFDWDRGNDGSWDYTTTQPALYQYFNLNAASQISVRGKDDDSVYSNKLPFYVFPDEPPPVPSQGNVTFPFADSAKLTWTGADTKDGDSTQFEIICDKQNPPTTILKPFGTCKKAGNGDFYFVFHPATTGRYYWKVIARDARGSETPTAGAPYFDF